MNAICPEATAGPRVERVIQAQADARNISFEAAKTPLFTDETALGTLVESDDSAAVAAFLASENGRHITAQDINADAGTVWY